jgi:hypothetical protein
MSTDRPDGRGGEQMAPRRPRAAQPASYAEGGPTISRRRLLTTGAGLGAALLVPSLAGGAGPAPHPASSHPHGQHGGSDGMGAPPTQVTEGLPLVEPEVRRAVGGEL